MSQPATKIIATPQTATALKLMIIGSDEEPNGILSWRGPKTKARLLRSWRRGVYFKFSRKQQATKIAWALEWLFTNSGYAYASDSFLAKETGLGLYKTQAALTELARGGAIIRAHILNSDGRLARRIYPSRQVLDSVPPEVGGADTPRTGRQRPPIVGGYNTYGKAQRSSEAQRYARLTAERNAERAAREPSSAIQSDIAPRTTDSLDG